MGTVTKITWIKFSVGDLVDHRLFDYRGVIVDVDEMSKGQKNGTKQSRGLVPRKTGLGTMCSFMGKHIPRMWLNGIWKLMKA